jgi:hypothetical protein
MLDANKDQMFLDVIPPKFPEGCQVVFMRPGELEAVGTIPLPVGSMLVYIPPEQATQVRGAMRKAIDLQREEMRRHANGLGNGSR